MPSEYEHKLAEVRNELKWRQEIVDGQRYKGLDASEPFDHRNLVERLTEWVEWLESRRPDAIEAARKRIASAKPPETRTVTRGRASTRRSVSVEGAERDVDADALQIVLWIAKGKMPVDGPDDSGLAYCDAWLRPIRKGTDWLAAWVDDHPVTPSTTDVKDTEQDTIKLNAESRAMAALVQHPELKTLAAIAKVAKCSREHLYNLPLFMAAWKVAKEAQVQPRRTGCKTIMMCDLAVSAAIPRAVRTAFCSGESGAPTVRETLTRVARAKGHALQDVLGLFFYPQVPKLSDPACMKVLEDVLRGDEIEMAIFDPFHLTCAPPGAVAITVVPERATVCRQSDDRKDLRPWAITMQ